MLQPAPHTNEAPGTGARRLVEVALERPFADMPVEVESIFGERSISLGEVTALAVGDFLRLEGANPQQLTLRICGVPAARVRSVEGATPRTVQIAEWLKKE